LIVRTKADLDGATAPGASLGGEAAITMSAKTGEGLEAVIARITAIAAERLSDRAGPPLTQERHRAALITCLECLRAFGAGSREETELRAEDLRRAAHALGRITGRVDVEDVLGEIFGRFCIGK
jgi:tRNA modification GTPase